ncbi:MAG: hypothetical protein AAGE94_01925 [Acidobacteriota bacterium]
MDEPRPTPASHTDWPRDLRDPLGGGAAWHPGTWALPATLLSFGSALTAVGVLLALDHRPAWRPPPPLDLVFALLAAIVASNIARRCRHRPGPMLPRLWLLALALVAGLSALGLATLDEPWRSLVGSGTSAMLAASLALLPRLGPRRLMPHDRRLDSIALLGPALGLLGVVGLQIVGTSALDVWQSHGHDRHAETRAERAHLCAALDQSLDGDLALVVRGEAADRLDHLVAGHHELAATPATWTSLVDAPADELAPCAGLLDRLDILFTAGLPTPARLTQPAFEHPPRPQRAGTPAARLVRASAPACTLQRVLGQLGESLETRLDSALPDAVADLRSARTAHVEALGRDWLDGWLTPCASDDAAPAPDLAQRLMTPPRLDPGRPDRWLDLTLAEAEALAAHEAACALRESWNGRTRRYRALDCVALAPAEDGRLDLVLELGLVFASAERRNADDPLPTLARSSRVASARLLVAVPAGRDPATYDRAVLDALRQAVEGAGGRLTSEPSTPWAVRLRFDRTTLAGTISAAPLPGGREGLAITLRRTGGDS